MSSANLTNETARLAASKNAPKIHLNSTIKHKSLKQLFNIGPHLVCILDGQIVKELKIDEHCMCEQIATKEEDEII